ncbi:MAG: FHA domain-containing protein [Deltaproteobacteria bacterium]|nr:FHA domain-containing protein [Deltaproteobacteria bacterium]
MTVASTKTGLGTSQWLIDDAVSRLRIWGDHKIFAIPADADITIGSSERCRISLHDPSGQISRQHARIVRERGALVIRDLGSKNGMRVDGARRGEIALEAGMEIGIGGVTLVAESARFVALRAFVARIIGWSDARLEALDLALRAVRAAAAHRAPLILAGEGDLVPIARALHGRALGPAKAFVQCDPRRRRTDATVRAAENYALGMPAFIAASGGSLCLRGRRLPSDFAEVRAASQDPQHRVQLIICTHDSNDAARCSGTAIEIPPLSTRRAELDRIIHEYGADAVVAVSAKAPFTRKDLEWVRQHSSASLPDIEKGTLRLVALREGASIARAASMLGMSHVALAEWIGRRRVPGRRS